MVSVKSSFGLGEDYFGKPDPAELEDGPTNYSTDNDDEEEVPNKTKKQTIRPCDVIMKKTREQLDIWLVIDPLPTRGILYLIIF